MCRHVLFEGVGLPDFVELTQIISYTLVNTQTFSQLRFTRQSPANLPLRIVGKLLMKTFTAKPETVQRDWYVVDATGKTLGRLAIAGNSNFVSVQNDDVITGINVRSVFRFMLTAQATSQFITNV
jgi:hypothetical protein